MAGRRGWTGAVVVLTALGVLAGCGADRAVTSSSAPGTTASTPSPGSPAGRDRAPGDRRPRGPGIVGRVTTAAGPVAGALVQVASLDTPPAAVVELAVFTGADGRYYWPVGAGAWKVTVTAAGYRPGTGRADVGDREPATLDIVLVAG